MHYFLNFLLLLCVYSATGQSNCDTKCFTKKAYSFSENPGTKLAFEKKWESADNITYRDQPKLYDVDNDGIPELISATATSYPNYSNQLQILNASNGNVIRSITTPYFANSLGGSVIIADVFDNCSPVIIMACSDESINDSIYRKRLVCFDLEGKVLWISDQPLGLFNNVAVLRNFGSLAIADFNLDGNPEVYIYNEIYNAQTGVKLVDGGRNGIGYSTFSSGIYGRTIAANLDQDQALELAAGYSVYDITINNKNGTAGNFMVAMNISFPDIGWDPFVFLDGFTSVADIDLDGKLDIVVTTDGGFGHFPNYDIGLYCYTIENNAPKLLAQHITTNGTTLRLTWNFCGIATLQFNKSKNVMDIFVSMYGQNQNQIMSFSYDGTTTLKVNWTYPIFDRISIVGCPIFDFDNDGNFELLHRDENTFRVISFINDIPRVLFSFLCNSDTASEYPLIGDFDNTGQAKICVPCQVGPLNSKGKIVVFGAPPGQKWAPARNIWHQYAYNPLFINDDGTIPQNMHNPATYKNGKYNNFMVQESLIDEDGNYPVAAASLTGSVSCIDYDVATQQYSVDFSINNRTDASASAAAGVSVSFYNGNPETGGTLLGVYSTLADINAGNTLGSLSYTFSASNLTSLWMIVNTNKYPITVSDTSYYGIDECDYTDNVFIAQAPVVSQSIQQICQGDSYDFFGTPLTNAGLYYHEKQDRNGCDSVVVALEIVVNICQTNCESKCYTTKKYPYPYQDENVFNAKRIWESAKTINMFHQLLAFDIDNDDEPEIISSNYVASTNGSFSNELLFYDIQDGTLLKSIKTHYFSSSSTSAIAIGDVTGDCVPEIFVAFSNEDNNPVSIRRKIGCYELNGNLLWVSDETYGNNVSILNLPKYGGSLQLADFNQDGIAEVYIFNEIFNSLTGIKLLDGGKNGIGHGNTLGVGCHSVSIGINLDDQPGLELVAGYTVYKINLTNLNGMIGNSFLAINLSINGTFYDGYTSVVDIDQDGELEIFINPYNTWGSIGSYLYSYKNNNPTLLAILGFFPNTIWHGGSILVDSPIKSNSQKQFMYITPTKIVSYTYDGSSQLILNWETNIDDGSSSAAVALFDLDGDGNKELIHRDEKSLKIIDIGVKPPKILFQMPCISGTAMESVIVLGESKNGEVRLCITCSDVFNTRRGNLVVLGPPDGYHWAPARNIWHQYAYNPLFINDDGTVPQNMHNPATYKNGKYNNFMVQESLIDEDGNYPVAAASLTGSVSCIDYDVATQQYTVDFSINNRADASASAAVGVSVSFYNDNPETGGTLLGVYRTLADINAGNTLGSLSYSFAASNLTALWMIVNTDKYPIIVADTSYYGIDECDYTDNVFIALAPVLSQSVQQICQGDSYDFFGTPLTSAGIYYNEKQDQNGCDSVVVALSLQVGQVKTVDVYTAACDTYTWNGTTYTTDGDYPYQVLSANGCDSITTLHLRLFRSNDVTLSQQSCESYTWRGQTYTSSGNYTYQTQNIHGCDSVVTLDLKIYPSFTSSITYAACDTYTWNGTTYTDSGIYTYQTQTSYGCDSTVTLNLTISDILRTNHPVTACDTYTWNGNTYDTDGDYTYQTISTNGCDSIATLMLTVNESSSNKIQQTACETYTWNGQTYDQSGKYTFATKNRYGCDSIISLDLTVNTSSISTTEISACGEFTWNSKTYTTSITDTYQSINASGCDSVATLRLTIHQPDNIVTQQNACYTYQWNGQTYTQSGVYTYQTQNRYGCDSITTLNLTVHPSDAVSLQLTECDTVVYLGRSISNSGTYTFNLQNQYGCDSVVTLNLTISADRITSSQTACEAYTWPINGQRYTQSGKYTQSYTNAVGCDSTYTLDLIINPNYDIPVNAEACAQYIWPVTQQRYTRSGVYTAPFQTARGCDSIFRLDLVIHPEFEFRDTVISNIPYVWPINNQTYETSGTYSQTFSTDVSCDSIHYLYLTIKNSTDITFPNIISPDGPNGFFTGYSNNASLLITNLSVYDRWGNLVFTKENLPVNDPQQGWDGKLEGNDVVQGVFTWLAKVQLKDGSEEVFYGDVTVVK